MDKQLTVHQLVPLQRVPKESVTALDSRVLCGAAGGWICWRVFALTVFLLVGTFFHQAEASASLSARAFFFFCKICELNSEHEIVFDNVCLLAIDDTER